VIRQTNTGNVTIYGRPPGDYYYRVRPPDRVRIGDYSNGVAIRVGAATGWRQLAVDAYNDHTLFSVHAALLRLSAARGDVLFPAGRARTLP